MFLLIPFLAGAGTTGYLWYKGKEKEKPTFKADLYATLTPIFLIIMCLLFLRWLHAKGTTPKSN
jgi:hypothetical protein